VIANESCEDFAALQKRLKPMMKIKCGMAHFEEFEGVIYRRVSHIRELQLEP
jgi:hypothetical protein